MNIQAVIFDRDNTLVHFDRAAIAALEARVAAAAPALPPGAAAAHWRSWPGPWPRSEDEEAEFWRCFWGELALRHHLTEAMVATLLDIGAFYHSCFVAFPDAAGCLRTLRARGLRLAVLTNFELPGIAPTLLGAGLDPTWFTGLFSSASIGVYKPDPRAYLAAAEALGLPPHACAFVDDLPENILGAQAVGMRGVLIERGGASAGGLCERIETLDQLVDLL
jgi:putative hydrolase of the HAD superfamily